MSDLPIHEIVIIGAGPAGISVAAEAIAKGYDPEKILLIEKSHEITHMIAAKYPEEKPVLANYKGKQVKAEGLLSIGDMSKSSFIQLMNKIILDSKIEVQFNRTVNKIVKLKNGQLQVCTDLECYITNSVFIAIGSMSASRKLIANVDVESRKRIFDDIQNITPEMKDVLVVGGGDSAAEYAMILKNRNHHVSLSYRGSEFTRMLDANSKPLQDFISKNEIIYYPKTEVESVVSKGDLLKVSFTNREQKSFHAIVAALGTDRPINYLASIGIQLCYQGLEIYSESSLPGVFAVGDIASSSGGTINIAFNSGAKALQEAYDYYLETPNSEQLSSR